MWEEFWHIFYLVAMSVVIGMTTFNFLMLIVMLVVSFWEKK